ncbi:aminodeoxychorismate synthase component I [Halomonas sp. MCCC 1A17488]|uniref:aminodeoxychorismate synthase n=1 Tax=Billgrantia sulfidoxydans TaxID=2733484 RepID=A0ABX7W7P6_9GAMM|nr:MULTISPECIES: aminodeoxychorismate synthase component I [Halomonas]MCE8018305.1 aminodeoxychorismate synthase component I [Halomonas sp. MCCC 1A17488]MCG3241638.1 aminodeoxychorismate synthase component I [Halomonas sp. MCCC 1A17488]QPP48416.1 aminodeoxychorismate synthase component I [Halomonas sp. SS10-MC5]QTP55727.1 aminodeoxychorismate synthase component I [Halomonas sulfidoxydans]
MTERLQISSLPYREDPRAYFASLRQRPGAVLLDSGRPAAFGGRYDIISSDPVSLLSVDGQGNVRVDGALCEQRNPFVAQQALLESLSLEFPASHLPFLGGLIGYWGYDLGRALEPVGDASAPVVALPTSRTGLYDWALIQDHREKASWLVATHARREQVLGWLHQPAPPGADFQLLSPFAGEMDRAGYARRFAAVQAYIRAGDCYQINLAQRFSAPYRGDLWSAYLRLRQATPTPFAGYMAWPTERGEQAILSLSPERFLHCRADGHVETRPIKGTRPRGATPEQDRRLADELKASHKDRAENVMIVDLLRNDLGRVCRPGSVRVPQLCGLESYANVHHLVSIVCGELEAGRRPLDLLAAAFPGGSITGAPKVRAMQIIDELEPSRRSVYCGSLGFVDVRGNMDTSIAIRTAVADGERLHLWGGGGLVADSDVEAEYVETLDKIRHLMAALEGGKA